MNQAELDSIYRWFDGYTRPFMDGQDRLTILLEMKLDHSRRVADIMVALARDTELPDAEVLVAQALGLLHDVGRFSQFLQYRTLNDRKSVNHGLRGSEVLDQLRPLAACSSADRRRITAAVRHHNDHHLPDHIGDDVLQFTRLIRDADKLDIYRTLVAVWESGELRQRPELVYNIDLEGPPNPAAVAELRAGRTVSYVHIQSLADFFLTMLSWMYDINFIVSYRRLAAAGVVEKIAGALPKDAPVQEAVAAAIRFFRQKLKT